MACASPAPDSRAADLAEVPEFVQGWIRSLLDPALLAMMRDARDRNVEVRLFANRSKIRRYPSLLIDAGRAEMVDPGEVA